MTNAELAILSLVAETQRHGYEIEQIIEIRGMREWTEIGFSSIYYLLNKLERAGQIASHNEHSSGKGPGRKVYSITPAGNAACQKAVIDALSNPVRYYLPIQLGLANLPSLPINQALAALQQYRQNLEQRQQQLQATWQQKKPMPFFVDAMFEHSMALIKAETGWVAEFIQTLQSGSKEELQHES